MGADKPRLALAALWGFSVLARAGQRLGVGEGMVLKDPVTNAGRSGALPQPRARRQVDLLQMSICERRGQKDTRAHAHPSRYSSDAVAAVTALSLSDWQKQILAVLSEEFKVWLWSLNGRV